MLKRFFRSEPAAGIVLFVAAVLAIVVANSSLESRYLDTLHAHLGPLSVEHWINDGLMAIFFLLVGLELKREFIEGELATWPARILPGIAAISGMAVPAIIFALVNTGEREHLRGWAIPSATDIAFAIGVLSLLGPRVPAGLRILLVSIAVMDDLGAIVVIALFYTSGLHLGWLAGAAVVMAAALMLNHRNSLRLTPYLVLGVLLWICVYNSGLHATIAGVLIAFTIPARVKGYSPVQILEHRLDTWVSFVVVPIFGFANAGLSFAGMGFGDLGDSLTLGIILGLLLGKPIGIGVSILVATRFRFANLPAGVSQRQVLGLAMLCGIGFTMSLFIGGLAFADHPHLIDAVKLGVFTGSALAGVLGFIWLRTSLASSPA
jgi:NhaA family Na+:H+ antiporter